MNPLRTNNRLCAFVPLCLCAFLIALTGCTLDMPMLFMPDEPVSPEAELFTRAEKLFDQRAYNKAMELYSEYLTRYPDDPYAPLAVMREASIYIEQKKPTAARRLWQYLISNYPESIFVPEARIGILGSLYEERSYSEVIREGNLLLSSLSAHHPRVRTIMGDAYIALRAPANAIGEYSLGYAHAVSSEKEEIRKKVKAAVNMLSEQELAALNEQSGYNPMLKGYLMYQIGLKQIRAEKQEEGVKTLSELVDNFPQHEIVPEAKSVLKRFKKPEEKQDMPTQVSPKPPQTRYKIGCLLPLSGPYAAYGNKALKGIELAKQVADLADIVVRDSGGTPEQGIQSVRELDEQQVSAIIGPMTVSDASAAEARTRGIPTIMLIQKSDIDTGNYLFRHFITPETQVEALVSYSSSGGIRNFAVLYPNEKYGTSFLTLFTRSVGIHGGKVVVTSSYSPNQTDFSSSLKKLAQAQFEALFIPDSAKKVGLILPQMSSQKIPPTHLLGTNLWHSEKLIEMAEQYAQGAVISSGFFEESRKPHVVEFVNRFQSAYNEKPEYIEAVAYDTAMMLLQIFRKSEAFSRNDIRDELLRLRYFPGVTGATSFDSRGEAIKKPCLLRVGGSSFVEIETP